MGIPTCVNESAGSWRGKSKLHLSWEPEGQRVRESESGLRVRLSEPAGFAVIEYTWDHDGPQSGAMVLCGDSKSGEVAAGWTDTWHLDATVIRLAGKGMEERVAVQGSYAVPGHPDWGWRIELGVDGSNLVLKMFNISPEGEEVWAVEAVYERC